MANVAKPPRYLWEFLKWIGQLVFQILRSEVDSRSD